MCWTQTICLAGRATDQASFSPIGGHFATYQPGPGCDETRLFAHWFLISCFVICNFNDNFWCFFFICSLTLSRSFSLLLCATIRCIIEPGLSEGTTHEMRLLYSELYYTHLIFLFISLLYIFVCLNLFEFVSQKKLVLFPCDPHDRWEASFEPNHARLDADI